MERIHVSVRARPLSPEDEKNSPWKISGNSIFIPNLPTKFDFDRIFGEDCRTREVYEGRTKDIVAAAVQGFNGTVFAYGQTNSGKTHTMRGSAGEPGVIPLSVHDLFEKIHQEVDREFLLRMSYMEIYNEEINDLLAPEHRKLQIHENIERGIYVAGLREEIVASPEQVLDLMEFGETHRHIGETNMNLHSSRSHTIFRMIIESRDKAEDKDTGGSCDIFRMIIESQDKAEDKDTGGSCDAVRVSVLNLVDLAGSERAAKTGAEGVRLKEGSHINKSLMTLGTVIKKLSEGAESQGGHVPYRDSKLTRILQPALGGNSNTAIICNITLAQIHADETKSSLLFASRALRVTNCARVNEILTDAALLKRQKKEIEELRAKLQGSHSEHLEEEILNLRNTLLQTELERERIALELEEEKKAQAERERRLQEQAKKIENLASMVLYSNRDEKRDNLKKEKRRDTWCPGNLSRENLKEASSIDLKSSAAKAERPWRDMGPLLPFEELVDEVEIGIDDSLNSDKSRRNSAVNLPNPKALLHVTSRKKAPLKNKCIVGENFEYTDLQAEYEDLLMEFHSQIIASFIQIDCLTRKLAEVDLGSCIKGKNNVMSLRESEALAVIKQLQDQITILEKEKYSNQQNLDNVVDLATEQNISARRKFEELSEELLIAQEEAKIAHERLAYAESKLSSNEADEIKLAMEVQDLYTEVHSMISAIDQTLALEDELFQNLSSMPKTFDDLKALSAETALQQSEIIESQQKLLTHMKKRVSELENEKALLDNHPCNLEAQIQDLKNDAENSQRTFSELKEQHELEKIELLMQIDNLQKEISYLSSSMLAKENVHLRKDLEKMKLKLKETESKLKNAVQEKTKLEGEKATAERELRMLHNQKVLLERDINKRESIAGRRRESMAVDPKRTKGQVALFDQTMQEEYKKLEVLAFEMEATIASLEEELAAAGKEKDELFYKNENLSLELGAQSEKMSTLYSDISILQEEVSDLSVKLEESKSCQQKLEESMKKLAEEKEELAIQLTNSLLEMEEEKVIWSAKEKASVKDIEEKEKLYDLEITRLSEEISEARKELQSLREQCKILEEKLQRSEDDAQKKKKHSLEMASWVEQLENNMQLADMENRRCQEELSCLKKEREDLLVQLKGLENQVQTQDDYQDKLKTHLEQKQRNMVELEYVQRSTSEKLLEAEARADKLTQKINNLEVKLHNEEVSNSKERAKLRMRLRGTQAKLDAYRSRYSEAINEQKLMDRKYEEGSGKLKGLLAQYGVEILNLKKQLAAANAHHGTT